MTEHHQLEIDLLTLRQSIEDIEDLTQRESATTAVDALEAGVAGLSLIVSKLTIRLRGYELDQRAINTIIREHDLQHLLVQLGRVKENPFRLQTALARIDEVLNESSRADLSNYLAAIARLLVVFV